MGENKLPEKIKVKEMLNQPKEEPKEKPKEEPKEDVAHPSGDDDEDFDDLLGGEITTTIENPPSDGLFGNNSTGELFGNDNDENLFGESTIRDNTLSDESVKDSK